MKIDEELKECTFKPQLARPEDKDKKRTNEEFL